MTMTLTVYSDGENLNKKKIVFSESIRISIKEVWHYFMVWVKYFATLIPSFQSFCVYEKLLLLYLQNTFAFHVLL